MSIGFGQILIIILVIVVIFGASRLPKIAEDLAKGMKAFKKGLMDEEPSSNETPTPATSKKLPAKTRAQGKSKPIKAKPQKNQKKA